MLGHLTPAFCKSSLDSKENYWEFYCSVCASLRKKHDLASSLLLNNELTLLLSAFQDEFSNLKEIKTACPAKAFLFKNYAFAHPAVDMAGDLSIVLGWIKALDWHTDKPHVAKKILVNRLYKKAQRVLPTLSATSQETIAEYARLTRENEQDFQVICQQSAALAQMLVEEIGLKVEASAESIALLKDLFGKAGELIAVADHLIDLDADDRKAQYNPILKQASEQAIPLAQAYLQLKTQYYQLRHQILCLLPQTNRAFAEAFRQSLYAMDKQIDKNLPACMHTPEAREMVGKLQTVQGSMANMPQMIPQASDCCNEACLGACLGACCQACSQGCCDSLCDSCCSGNCCSSNNSADAEMRREQRRQEREQRRQERELKKQEKNKNKGTNTEKEKEKEKKKNNQNPDGAY